MTEDKNSSANKYSIPVLHILLQDQVQPQHANQDYNVLHPCSVNCPIKKLRHLSLLPMSPGLYIKKSLSKIHRHNLVLTSFVEFTTASTSRFHGFPLHRYVFELISWSTGNLETIPLILLPPPDWEVKGSGKYEFENEGSSLSYSKEERCSELLHRGT